MTRHKLLTEQEVSEWLKISVATLRTNRSRPPADQSPIPFTKIAGRVYYREDMIQKWIEQQTFTPDEWSKTQMIKYRRNVG